MLFWKFNSVLSLSSYILKIVVYVNLQRLSIGANLGAVQVPISKVNRVFKSQMQV